MNALPPQSHQRREFELLLDAARSKIHRAAVRAQISVASERALRAMVGVAVVYALVCAGCLVIGVTPFGWITYGCLLAAALIVRATMTMTRAFRAVPSLMEAAQRLDLGAGEHNRVAIGLSLVNGTMPSLFGQAAVKDGMACLRHIRDGDPRVDRSLPPWRRLAITAVLLLGFTIVAGLCAAATQSSALTDRSALIETVAAPARYASAGPAPARREPAITPAPITHDLLAGFAQGREATLGAEKADPSRAERAAGHTRAGVSGPAESPARSARAAGQPSSASASSVSRGTDEKDRRLQRDNLRDKIRDPRKPAAHADSSATSAGSAGRGSPSPVHHDSAQRAQTANDDRQEEEREEEQVEDERESNTQRGGIQPSLKDRQEAPGRELGISGEQGSPGTGRGGPTPPKKSRGTASLVLGVPIPDFVKGRLGPGTTKITRQRVQPSSVPGDPATPAVARSRSLPESVCPRFEAPLDFATIVRDYLVALHSADADADALTMRQRSQPSDRQPPEE